MFKKIHPNQINLAELQNDNRLGLYVTDVVNASGTNTINVIRYDAIGDVDPVLSFSTPESMITMTFEWEGLSRVWDGSLTILGNTITRADESATFEALPGRRFRCSYTFDRLSVTEVTYSLQDESGVTVANGSVTVDDFVAANPLQFNFVYGVHTSGATNEGGRYPFNTIYEDTGTITATQVEQSALKTGDYVLIQALFDLPVSKVAIYDPSNAFGGNTVLDVTESTQFQYYLEVTSVSNLSNVELQIQGFSNDANVWGPVVSTNETGDDIDMSGIVNIDNTLPSGTSSFAATKDALDNNDTGLISYGLSANTYWQYDQIAASNTNFATTFTMNVDALHDELTIGVHPNLVLYDLNKQFNMPIINSVNGKIATISTTVPIASDNHEATFNLKSLTSAVGGNTHTIVATFDQSLDQSTMISATIDSSPDVNIAFTGERYNSTNEIRFETTILDSYVRGPLQFTLNGVKNLSGRTLDFQTTYQVRGFTQRTIYGAAGSLRLPLPVRIKDEVGFIASLANNGSIMNYKPWNGGAVLSTAPFTQVNLTNPTDQYAYTFDPVNQEIVIGVYTQAFLVGNAPIIVISKS